MKSRIAVVPSVPMVALNVSDPAQGLASFCPENNQNKM